MTCNVIIIVTIITEFPVSEEIWLIRESRHAHKATSVEVISWKIRLKTGGKYKRYFIQFSLFLKT
jgi:hypothetical protein